MKSKIILFCLIVGKTPFHSNDAQNKWVDQPSIHPVSQCRSSPGKIPWLCFNSSSCFQKPRLLGPN